MPDAVPKPSVNRHLAVLCAGACLLLTAGAGAAQAATVGVVPPRNPASDCNAAGGTGISAIDACRATEGIGPLKLPSNWGSLTAVQQGFVLIELERVNRGLPAIVGLSAPLDGLTSSAAANGSDPSFPAGAVSGGGIWAGAYSVFGADYMWMYADGPGGNNLDCSSGGGSGCWGHRDIILWDRTPAPLVSGGGFATAGGTDSFAYLVLSGYSTANLSFSWSSELKYFASKPGPEPLGKPARARRHKKNKHRRHHKVRHFPTVSASSSSGSSGSSSSSSSSGSGSGPTISIG